MKIPKTIKRTFITIFVLLVLFFGGGAIYVYITGKNARVDDVKPVATQPEESNPIAPPVAPADNAGVGVAVASLLSPITAGANTSLSVNTNAGASCTITATYKDKPSTDSGLTPKIANPYGSVSWTWTVDSTAPVGKWPVKVTCAYHGRTGVVVADLVVEK